MILDDDIKSFVKEHEEDDIRVLALQAKRYPNIDMPLAIQQIAGKKASKNKIPSWYLNEDIIYPKHLSMEQCSSEPTALYKASLVKGKTMVDLTGGLGIDFAFLSKHFERATYIEQQEELVDIAQHNFEVLGLNNTTTINADAVTYLEQMQPVDLIYIDPARRNSSGKKTVLIEDCTPNIIELESLLEQKANIVIVKLSPMLDISLATKSLHNISDIHIISHNNECKELLFIKNKGAKDTLLHCANITNSKTDLFSFYKKDEEQITINYTTQLEQYLYEPNTSIIKAGAYKSIAMRYPVQKLHPSSHLYTSNEIINDFPGRRFTIMSISGLNKNELKAQLTGIDQANITVRNFPISVEEIRKRTKLKDGGDIYIFATTLANDKKYLVICKKI